MSMHIGMLLLTFWCKLIILNGPEGNPRGEGVCVCGGEGAGTVEDALIYMCNNMYFLFLIFSLVLLILNI